MKLASSHVSHVKRKWMTSRTLAFHHDMLTKEKKKKMLYNTDGQDSPSSSTTHISVTSESINKRDSLRTVRWLGGPRRSDPCGTVAVLYYVPVVYRFGRIHSTLRQRYFRRFWWWLPRVTCDWSHYSSRWASIDGIDVLIPIRGSGYGSSASGYQSQTLIFFVGYQQESVCGFNRQRCHILPFLISCYFRKSYA